MAFRGQSGRQLLVGPGQPKIGPELPPRRLHVRGDAGALLPPQHAGAQRPATIGALLPGQPVEVARVLSEPEGAFLMPQGSLDLPLGERELPHTAGPGVHPVHEEMEMRVAAVAVRHDHRVMVGEPEVEEELVSDHDHGLPPDDILQVEAHGKVVDRFLRGRGGRHCGHDRGRIPDGGRPHVPPLEPVDPSLTQAVVAVLQV
jgi:hypothetical protein